MVVWRSSICLSSVPLQSHITTTLFAGWLCHTITPTFTRKRSDWAQHQSLPREHGKTTACLSLLAILFVQRGILVTGTTCNHPPCQICQDICSFICAVSLLTIASATIRWQTVVTERIANQVPCAPLTWPLLKFVHRKKSERRV